MPPHPPKLVLSRLPHAPKLTMVYSLFQDTYSLPNQQWSKISILKTATSSQPKTFHNKSFQSDHTNPNKIVQTWFFQDHHTISNRKQSKISPFQPNISSPSKNCPKLVLSRLLHPLKMEMV